MAMLEPDVSPERKKKTVWLLAGGAASLLIPLAGAIYLHVSQNSGPTGPTGRSDVFERRDGTDKLIVPTQSAVVTAPSALTPVPSGMVAGTAQKPAESSLDFIQGGSELKAKMADSKAISAGPPAASTAPAAPAVAAAEPPAPAKKTKPGKKAFTMPKLQPTRGFSNFSSASKKSGSQAASTPDLSGLPPGAANDPRVQAYLKEHQQGQ